MSDQFYVTLLSNASEKLYPENAIGAFTVELARLMYLAPDTNWEVGLCEFKGSASYVGTVQNLTVVGDQIGFIYCDLISSQFVGDSLIRFLKTYVYPSIACQFEFKNVYYFPVEKRRINTCG
jgi:hypothetical protein